jgi:hypothetical protein
MSCSNLDRAFIADWNDGPPAPCPSPDYRRRALGLWPGLDRGRLHRTGNDPLRIARLVSRGTGESTETILVLLLRLA